MAEGTKQDSVALGSGFRAEDESEGETERPTDVLVVGAGPVGLTLAIALAHLSLHVRVVDKAPETKREPRAAVLWPRAMEILDDLGVADDFEMTANELHSIDVYGDGYRLGELDVGHVRSAHPYPLVVEQHDTERLLARQLARLGVRVEWRTEADDVRLFDDRVEVILKRADGSVETAEASWVVGCEGTRSIAREKVGIPFKGSRRKNLQVFQANAVPNWRYAGSSNNGYFFLVPHIALGVFPIPGGGYRFFAFTDDPDPSRKNPPTLEEMRVLVAKAAHAPELELELTEPVWVTRARFQDRIAATLRCGRVLLVGDAAHAWAPVGGHGMNAGIRGAYNLAWKLAAVHLGEAHADLLETYSQEQRATAHAVIREMRFNVLEQPLPPIGLRTIRTLLPLALASGTLRRRVEFALSDLGMHHREGTLSWHREGRQRLRAGDRTPDVGIVADGRRTNLHRLLSLEHWTLFLPSGNKEGARRVCEAVASVRASIHVVSVAPAGPEAERALGFEESMMLIRPDGHIGLLARSDDSQALVDYLRAFFVPSAREMGTSIVGAKAGTEPPASSP